MRRDGEKQPVTHAKKGETVKSTSSLSWRWKIAIARWPPTGSSIGWSSNIAWFSFCERTLLPRAGAGPTVVS